MPVTNQTGGFNTGRDLTLVLIAGDGSQVDLTNITQWDTRQKATDVAVKRLDGLRLHGMLPDGWEGTFTIERLNGTLDDLFAAQEVQWLDGGIIQNATMYQYVIELDSSTSTYEFTNVAMKLDNAGDYSADKTVAQKVSWAATRRRTL